MAYRLNYNVIPHYSNDMNHGINNENQLNIQQSQFTRNLLNNDPIQNTEEKTIVYAQTSLES